MVMLPKTVPQTTPKTNHQRTKSFNLLTKTQNHANYNRKTAVSAKDVKEVRHYFSINQQRGFVRVKLSDGTSTEESFDSESETEANYQRFIEDVNLALKDWL